MKTKAAVNTALIRKKVRDPLQQLLPRILIHCLPAACRVQPAPSNAFCDYCCLHPHLLSPRFSIALTLRRRYHPPLPHPRPGPPYPGPHRHRHRRHRHHRHQLLLLPLLTPHGSACWQLPQHEPACYWQNVAAALRTWPPGKRPWQSRQRSLPTTDPQSHRSDTRAAGAAGPS